MKCPYCGKDNNRVTGKKNTQKSDYVIKRYRKCYGCGRSFKTYEYLSDDIDIVREDPNSDYRRTEERS